MKKTWTFELDDRAHTLELEQTGLAARKKLYLDGEPLPTKTGSKSGFFSENDLLFNIAAHSGRIVHHFDWRSSEYELFLDDRSLDTGKPYLSAPPIPPWAWVFAGLCALIPLLSLGGLFPLFFGLGGAAGCIAIARDTRRKTLTRVLLCLAMTVLSWFLYLLMIAFVSPMGS